MNIKPMMRSPGHVPHLLPAPRLGEPELHRGRFSCPFLLTTAYGVLVDNDVSYGVTHTASDVINNLLER